MKNKQHEHILSAFIESRIPRAIMRSAPGTADGIDSYLGSFAFRLLNGDVNLAPSCLPMISKEEKDLYAKIINEATGEDKTELVIYYRLMVLAEAVILQYTQD